MGIFDPLAAYHITSRLAKPRMVKTTGEIETRQVISNLLRKSNLPVYEHWFKFFPGFAFTFLKLGLALILFLMVIQMVLLRNHMLLAALLGMCIPAGALLLKRFWEYFERNMHLDFSRRFPFMKKFSKDAGVELQTANFETVLPAEKKTKGIVYLTAHYDSKSQNMSISFRIICTAVVYLGIFILPAAYLIALVFPGLWGAAVFRILTYSLFVATIIAGYFLILLTVENKSPGATDNAASCGMLLTLAEMWAKEEASPYENLEIRIVFTGAEELGLAGASELVRQNRERWLKEENEGKKIYFLNFDGVGMSRKHSLTAAISLFPHKGHVSHDLLGLVKKTAKKLNLPIRHLKGILGGEADHMPLIQAGQAAVSIGSISNAVFSIHTENDTLDKVDPNAIEASAELTQEILKALDEKLTG